MSTVSLAEAKANLSKIIDRVQAGDAVEITKRGKPVARLTPMVAQRKQIDLAALQAFSATIPWQDEDAGTFMRSMRDSDRA